MGRFFPIWPFLFGSLFLAADGHGQSSPKSLQALLDARRVMLPNGWSISPAGHSIPLREDLPLNMSISPSGKYLAVTNNGYGRQSIDLINIPENKIVDDQLMGKSWGGLQFSGDGRFLYASGGNDNIILRFRVASDKLADPDTIRLGNSWPVKISPTGLALDDSRGRLYVVTKENNSLYVVDTRTKKIIQQQRLGAEAYSCVLSPGGKWLYISLWGGEKVAVFNVVSGTISAEIPVGSHPNDMVLTRDGRYLYVANANDNSVSVIRTSDHIVVETMIAAPYPGSPTGSTTNALALSADQHTLYVANADNNCLAVFDISQPGQSHSRGFIPVGWYPTCVRIRGNLIFVSNGRGFSSKANPAGPDPLTGGAASGQPGGPVQYIGGLFKGAISVIPAPTDRLLATYTAAVYRNTLYRPGLAREAQGEAGNPIPRRPGDPSPIKYIFYIIRENRTYDEVLGDMKEGNGDSSICLFGEKVTPNAHAIARQFVLFDNFYVDATVSADGHNWSMAAYATDYTNKTWPTQYSGRGGTYDYQGTRQIAYPREGYIWDHCKKTGIAYRDYGEFTDNGIPTDFSLLGHTCRNYPGWDLKIQDVFREGIWARDFDSLVSAHALPAFNTIYLPQDHTSGLSAGAYTPFAHVADNDLALGRLVDHISHSSVWSQCAIFVLEDDAQNGPDHVDAHRSPVYVISPYIIRHNVDHTMYSTSGLLRTIELIIGLPPMSQYDAAATPMFRSFSAKPDLQPFNVLPAEVDINARNPSREKEATASAGLDLTKPDATADLVLNRQIWESVRGDSSSLPPPRHSAFVSWRLSPTNDDN